VAVNAALANNPSLVNDDPFGDGWLFTVRVRALGQLLDSAGYTALVAGTATGQ
jgi:glycine cleavage system H protein